MNIPGLPERLLRKATTVGAELAWSIGDVREVIECVRDLEIAVLGVELWLFEENDPRVLGWSTYDVSFEHDWKSFVEKNAAAAILELNKPVPKDALVNLNWITRSEFSDNRS